MRGLFVSIEGSCLAEKKLGTLSKVFLVHNLDLNRSVVDVTTLLMELRLVNRVKFRFLFLLEVTLHL